MSSFESVVSTHQQYPVISTHMLSRLGIRNLSVECQRRERVAWEQVDACAQCNSMATAGEHGIDCWRWNHDLLFVCSRWWQSLLLMLALELLLLFSLARHDDRFMTGRDTNWMCIQYARGHRMLTVNLSRLSLTARATSLAVSPPLSPSSSLTARRSLSSAARPSTSLESSSAPSVCLYYLLPSTRTSFYAILVLS